MGGRKSALPASLSGASSSGQHWGRKCVMCGCSPRLAPRKLVVAKGCMGVGGWGRSGWISTPTLPGKLSKPRLTKPRDPAAVAVTIAWSGSQCGETPECEHHKPLGNMRGVTLLQLVQQKYGPFVTKTSFEPDEVLKPEGPRRFAASRAAPLAWPGASRLPFTVTSARPSWWLL